MHIATATCYTDDFAIADFLRPKFSKEFIGGMTPNWLSLTNTNEILPVHFIGVLLLIVCNIYRYDDAS